MSKLEIHLTSGAVVTREYPTLQEAHRAWVQLIDAFEGKRIVAKFLEESQRNQAVVLSNVVAFHIVP